MKDKKGLIRFIIDDLKGDFDFLRRVICGKYRPKLNKKYLNELLDLKGIIKQNWLMFFVVAFAFSCGFILATGIAEYKCNDYIQNEILTDSAYFYQTEMISYEELMNGSSKDNMASDNISLLPIS